MDVVAPQLTSTMTRWTGNLFAPGGQGYGNEPSFDFHPPSLSEVLESGLPSPERSVLLGMGVDEGVYFLDLDNPASGATLLIGDQGCERSGMLRSMLASATLLISHHRVSISVLCRKVREYEAFVQTQHLQEMLPVNEPISSEFIRELADEAVERSRGKRPEPVALLFIDDLAECLSFLDREAYERLYWLVRHGPRYKIWTVTSLPAAQFDYVDQRFLAAFRTWLVGHIRDRRLAAMVAPAISGRLGSLKPDQFYTDDREAQILICKCSAD